MAGVGAGLAALAGCAGLRPEPDGLTYTLNTDHIGDGDALANARTWGPEDRDEAWRRAWERVTSGETVETVGYEPLPGGEHTERDGVYYLLRSAIVGQRAVERPALRLSWVGDSEADDTPTATPLQSIPDADRNPVKIAYFAARAREHGGGGAPWEVIERGGYVYRRDVGGSELVPESEHDHVRMNGTVLRVEPATVTVHDPVYETDARPIADSVAGFVDAVEAAELDARLDAGELEGEARHILSRAGADAGYEEGTPLSDAYERVLRKLRLRELLHADRADAVNQRLLRSGDTYYRYALYVND
jgi:hypothetical protein